MIRGRVMDLPELPRDRLAETIINLLPGGGGDGRPAS